MTTPVIPETERSPVDVQAIHRAAQRLQGWAVTTPLLRCDELDAHAGGRVYLKAENLQHSGSFKFRGACNRILALTPGARARGVVAYSSGNHALAVSQAGRMLDVAATVIMPADAPAIKIEGCRASGATVLLYDREHEDREAIGRRLVVEQGLTLVPPFDDALVMAGAGTGALEAVAQMQGPWRCARHGPMPASWWSSPRDSTTRGARSGRTVRRPMRAGPAPSRTRCSLLRRAN